jgi:hypothetical protein
MTEIEAPQDSAKRTMDLRHAGELSVAERLFLYDLCAIEPILPVLSPRDVAKALGMIPRTFARRLSTLADRGYVGRVQTVGSSYTVALFEPTSSLNESIQAGSCMTVAVMPEQAEKEPDMTVAVTSAPSMTVAVMPEQAEKDPDMTVAVTSAPSMTVAVMPEQAEKEPDMTVAVTSAPSMTVAVMSLDEVGGFGEPCNEQECYELPGICDDPLSLSLNLNLKDLNLNTSGASGKPCNTQSTPELQQNLENPTQTPGQNGTTRPLTPPKPVTTPAVFPASGSRTPTQVGLDAQRGVLPADDAACLLASRDALGLKGWFKHYWNAYLVGVAKRVEIHYVKTRKEKTKNHYWKGSATTKKYFKEAALICIEEGVTVERLIGCAIDCCPKSLKFPPPSNIRGPYIQSVVPDWIPKSERVSFEEEARLKQIAADRAEVNRGIAEFHRLEKAGGGTSVPRMCLPGKEHLMRRGS